MIITFKVLKMLISGVLDLAHILLTGGIIRVTFVRRNWCGATLSSCSPCGGAIPLFLNDKKNIFSKVKKVEKSDQLLLLRDTCERGVVLHPYVASWWSKA